MPLPSKPLRDWGEPELEQLIADPPAEESARLEFERECALLNPGPEAQKNAQRDILVDIASMANAAGGGILIGVDQDRRADRPPVAKVVPGIPEGDVEKLREKIWSLVDNHLDARPPRPLITPVPLPGKPGMCVLVVQVQQNTYSLSMVTLNGLNQFWQRRGWDNKRMSTDEIKDAFEQMSRLRRPAEVELRRIEKRISEGIAEPVAWVAVVPIRRVRDHMPTDQTQLTLALEPAVSWRAILKLEPPESLFSPRRYQPFARGMRCQGNNLGFLSEIHRDGTVVHRFPVYDWTRGSDPNEEPVLLKEIYGAWLGGLCLFGDLGRHFGFPAVAVAGAGCLNLRGHHLRWLQRQVTPPPLDVDTVTLEPMLLPEEWDAKSLLQVWARELANWLGKSHAIPWPPFVGEGEGPDNWDELP